VVVFESLTEAIFPDKEEMHVGRLANNTGTLGEPVDAIA
jgi:hypothetical protein